MTTQRQPVITFHLVELSRACCSLNQSVLYTTANTISPTRSERAQRSPIPPFRRLSAPHRPPGLRCSSSLSGPPHLHDWRFGGCGGGEPRLQSQQRGRLLYQLKDLVLHSRVARLAASASQDTPPRTRPAPCPVRQPGRRNYAVYDAVPSGVI